VSPRAPGSPDREKTGRVRSRKPARAQRPQWIGAGARPASATMSWSGSRRRCPHRAHSSHRHSTRSSARATARSRPQARRADDTHSPTTTRCPAVETEQLGTVRSPARANVAKEGVRPAPAGHHVPLYDIWRETIHTRDRCAPAPQGLGCELLVWLVPGGCLGIRRMDGHPQPRLRRPGRCGDDAAHACRPPPCPSLERRPGLAPPPLK
jgi:hypothetical protein